MGLCVSTSLAHPGGEESTGAPRPGMKRRRSKKARREERGRLFSSMFGGGAVDKAKRGGGGGECLREEELHRVPGRMCMSGASERACLFTQQGRKGTNQDAMLVWENFCSRDDTVFCGVFDGHGPFGHMVAKKVRDSLPLKISNQWGATNSDNDSAGPDGSCKDSRIYEETASISIDDEWVEPIDVNESEKLPEMYRVLRQSLLKAFKLMDKELKLHETIDCFCSGTTAVTFVKQGNDLVIGNVGDSRAVLGTRDEDSTLIAVQLTVDLKPNLPREAARIQQCKGRVFALQDEPEVARVWLPNNDSPGLAMARAFGDFCLKDYGLISVPDVTYRHLTGRDEFIVLATDGVWDVLSNKEVVDVVASAPTRATAARALVDCAVRAWRLKYPTSKTDDCAVVCLFLDSLSSSDRDRAPQNLPQEPTEEVGSGLTDQISIDAQEANALVSDNTNSHCSELEHSYNPEGSEEIVPVIEDKDDKLHERCQSTRSLADCISTKEEEEWSALQGITRVNTLLNLPRFLSTDKKSIGKKK